MPIIKIDLVNFMSEQSTLPEIKKLESVLELAEKHLPRMIAGSEKAVAKMQVITVITSEEEYEEAEGLLIRVKEAYEKINELRTEITSPMDEAKKYLMAFERPLGDDKASEYTRVRGVLAAYRQAELDKKKEIEAAAAKKKAIDDHIVDLKTQVLKNLNEMLLMLTKKSDSGSADYFKASTLDNFDARAELFMKMKPRLKEDDYNNCFMIKINADLLKTEPGRKAWIEAFKKEESYEKWNENVIGLATPIINEWRAKIPELKQQLIDLKNATDESERTRLASEQQKKADDEAARRNAALEQQALDQSREIDSQAGLSKLENSFVEQAVVQQSGDTGPVKYVLKFTDVKKIPSAFMNIVYQCMAHKEFPGIQKKDKSGKLLVDDKGRPEYIDGIQFWINFFMSKCDAEIEGTTVYEDSKITIRK